MVHKHGYYFEDLKLGMCASLEKVFSDKDVLAYVEISEDDNPLHLDVEFAATTRVKTPIMHGMVTASLISALVGTKLPGPGCLWMSQELKFLAPTRVGDRVHATAEVMEIIEDKQRVKLNTICRVGDTIVIDGEALIWAPSKSDKF